MADDNLKEVIKVALDYRKRAKTFRSMVGIAYEMYDGRIIGGFNIETYALEGSIHAEKTGIILAANEGYSSTDFRRMVEVFQDAGHDKTEVFPACPTCWRDLWEFTHPYLEIIVADTEGNVLYKSRLNELFGLKRPASVYPSNDTRAHKPRSNMQPRLPLDKELEVFYGEDRDFRRFCDDVIKVRHKPA